MKKKSESMKKVMSKFPKITKAMEAMKKKVMKGKY